MFASLHVLNLLFGKELDFARSGLVYYFVSEFLALLCMYVSGARVSFHRNQNICKAWVRFHRERDFSPVF